MALNSPHFAEVSLGNCWLTHALLYALIIHIWWSL